ncbi:MAG: C4-type zinc ribbon domain-containing protein [Chitinophagales bacterium]|jgi:hypothetical protein|nr:C4-type zinc ribbon domain-containing protein [Chitinophagales bacterium]
MAKSTQKDSTIQEVLENLYQIQKVHSQIDSINFIKGELPIEVQDAEDYIEGMKTRLTNFELEIDTFDEKITERQKIKDDMKSLIVKLEKQQNSVKNNREFESISKEIEISNLDIELSDKKIKEFTEKKNNLILQIEELKAKIDESSQKLEVKKIELKKIEEETDKELQDLELEVTKLSATVDENLFASYQKIRKSYRNGLAIVSVDRDSCGGCFSKVPPQRQLEVKLRKKIMICENCGRILCYPNEAEQIAATESVEEPKKATSRSKRAKL